MILFLREPRHEGREQCWMANINLSEVGSGIDRARHYFRRKLISCRINQLQLRNYTIRNVFLNFSITDLTTRNSVGDYPTAPTEGNDSCRSAGVQPKQPGSWLVALIVCPFPLRVEYRCQSSINNHSQHAFNYRLAGRGWEV